MPVALGEGRYVPSATLCITWSNSSASAMLPPIDLWCVWVGGGGGGERRAESPHSHDTHNPIIPHERNSVVSFS